MVNVATAVDLKNRILSFILKQGVKAYVISKADMHSGCWNEVRNGKG